MKQTTKNILGVGAIILLSSGVAGLTTYKLLQSNESAKETSFNEMFKQNPNVKLAAFDAVNAQPVDLTQAAENSLHAVVHIRSTQEAKTRTVQQAPDIFDFFFGDGRGQQRQVQSQPRVGFGSGVIISKDGYIVTNEFMQTDIPMVYAVGDIRNTPLRQVVTAASDGAIAAVYIEKEMKNIKG